MSSETSTNAPRETGIPPRAPDAPTKVYSGGCHCGKFTFELRHPIVEDGFEVVSCNCSICTQRGYLLIYSMDPQNDFKITNGEPADLARYTFNTGMCAHMFCTVCGCGIFEEFRGDGFHGIGVNARAIEGLDLDALKLKKCNGRDEL